MSQIMTVTYYHHSGFSVASDDVLLVFDYWLGQKRELSENLRITPDYLAQFKEVYVFISHDHVDHFDDVVFSWEQYAPVTYIVADDMPTHIQGRRMGPGGKLTLSDRVNVRAFGSTDAGVSYLVQMDGRCFFHAGDLNFWHWREVSTAREIEIADEDFRKEIAPIPTDEIDLAFFPVDPRMGMHFDAGANYFMLSCKPRLLIPMHFWDRADIIVEFARRSRSRETEIIPMTTQGQSIRLAFDEDGFMTIHMMPLPTVPKAPEAAAAVVSLDGYEGKDPFSETDLPVDMAEGTGE
ncbi:MAG: MBL fold metallo-hydrolase [Clostridia bacterium]|nr:MBL fold metallo-hydrolase [Clostridia bacterium]